MPPVCGDTERMLLAMCGARPLRLLRGLAFGLAWWLGSAAGRAAPNSAEVPVPAAGGAVVAIGGGLRADNEAVWQRLVQLAGGPGAHFVVLGVASANPQASAERVVGWLARHGAQAEFLPVPLGAARLPVPPALLERVHQAGGVFFTGGAQERLVEALQPQGQPTPLLGAIEGVLQRGGVVAGTSAGAAVLSRVMFRDAPSVVDVLKGALRDGQQIDRGLGLLNPDLFLDQHFLKRGRFARLIPAMLAKGIRLGLGLDDNTAAVFQGGVVDVVGPGGAVFIDLARATTDPRQAAFNVRDVQLSYLEQGDRIDLITRHITPSAPKQAGQRLAPGQADYRPSHTEPRFVLDMTGDQAIAHAMRYLIDSNQTAVEGLAFDPLAPADDARAALGFRFRLHKAADSVGWSTEAFGGERFTVLNLRLDIQPVRLAQPLFTDWPVAPAR